MTLIDAIAGQHDAMTAVKNYSQMIGAPLGLLEDYFDECDRSEEEPSIDGFHAYWINEDDSYYADCAWQSNCRTQSSPVIMTALDGSSFAAQMNALTRCRG